MKYDPASAIAQEFIHHEEIMKTIEYGKENADNKELIRKLLKKAGAGKGLSHREAFVLLSCEDPLLIEEIFEMAKKLKLDFYGNRIVLFAPLYLSNYCVNGCVYCPFHYRNKDIPRKKLTQEEIRKETIALQDMGHKRLALEAGEDPVNCSIDYILESIETIYSIHHKNGDIRRVNVNIAATTVEDYKKLHDAGIGTYILFQETYHQDHYEELHPTGPKSNYAYHTEAMDRAMEGGIDDVGLGVLFGLNNYKYDFIGLLMHAEHLEARYHVGPHTISVPRIQPASDVNPEDFNNSISDEIFERIVAVIRLAVPYTGMILSTRESMETRARVLELGISQISGGSKTSVGGYAEEGQEEAKGSEQFEVDDNRTLDEVVEWLVDMGYLPSFCTACYRQGRTGETFMEQVKSGHLGNICQPNALITLQEYLCDYGDSKTIQKGQELIDEELRNIYSDKVQEKTNKLLEEIREGLRDVRF